MVSTKTRNNWLLDAALFLGALLASLSGIYFLFLPNGGYQGGRNPAYEIPVLFDRHTWDTIHLWTGLLMIFAAVVHISLHWGWITSMTRRLWLEVTNRKKVLNPRGRFNVWLDIATGASFLLCALSGIYFMFFPGHSQPVMFLFSGFVWDMLHTWSGVVLMLSAAWHLAIHWQWVLKVSRRLVYRKVNSPEIARVVSPAA